MILRGMILRGMSQCGMILRGMIQRGMSQCGMILRGMIQCGMALHGNDSARHESFRVQRF